MTRRLTLITIGLLTLLFSCDIRRTLLNHENELSKKNKHKDLIDFQAKYLRELTYGEFKKSDFAKTKITKEKISDTLKINVELPWSGCAQIDGDIEIKKDSLILKYWLRYEELCTELVYYEMKYTLTNKSNTDYKLKLEHLK